MGMLRAPCNLNLKTSRAGTSAVSLRNLCECLTTLPTSKEVFSNYCSPCVLEDAFLPTKIVSCVKQDEVEVENFL